jgi:hypothetical protein
MSRIQFQAWPKIARLHKDIVVTEKIDGTNAAVVITDAWDVLDAQERGHGAYDYGYLQKWVAGDAKIVEVDREGGVGFYLVAAQSRKQLITPAKDNFGFARWVYDRAEKLVDTLGPGRHFGEWWGSGIQRGYGLQKGEKRFSLFNIRKYLSGDDPWRLDEAGISTVPVLYEGPFSEQAIEDAMQRLDDGGSVAAPGFDRPEGVVVYHTAAGAAFKWTFDDAAKGTPYTPDRVDYDALKSDGKAWG